MSILVDHNVPAKFVRLLNEWGYEASRLTKHLDADADDIDVIALAQTLDPYCSRLIWISPTFLTILLPTMPVFWCFARHVSDYRVNTLSYPQVARDAVYRLK